MNELNTEPGRQAEPNSDDVGASDEGAQDDASPGDGRRRRGRRSRRPPPPDIVEADEVEDGHLRIIDPRDAGAEIFSDHGLKLDDIDPDAIKVLRRLHRYGFQSFLVGGCVRDLLCGLRPKDFDIATSATPRQVKKLFRNSRIIGRRFRLVHVHFGHHVLEVSTFRREAPKSEGDDPMIRRDNLFGQADEDARRRDFTCNALFYDIEANQVIDFIGGMRDIRRKVIEVIGDPVTRLREDPVRMLRAVKFAGRLRFEIAQDLLEAIDICRDDLRKAAAPRLYEELQRLINRGGAWRSFQLLQDTRLLHVFLPELDDFLETAGRDVGFDNKSAADRFWSTLKALDKWVQADNEATHVVTLACLFCHFFDHILHHAGPIPEGVPPVTYDIGIVTDEVLGAMAVRLQMPRRDVYRLTQIILCLRRFISDKTKKRRPSAGQLIRKDYFKDAFDFFQIYSQATGKFQAEVAKWEKRLESPAAH